MSEEAGVIAGGEVASAAPVSTTTNDAPLTVREAAAAYTERTKRPEENTNSTVGAENTAATDTKSAVEAGTAPSNEGPGETQGKDPAEEPPIERPRSWSKDDDDDWNALPRTRQEKIAANERAREADINRRINEAADKLKGLTAKEQEVDKVRQEYEAKLPAVMQKLQDEYSQEFPDIKSMADVEKIANGIKVAQLNNDPFTAGELANYLTRWNAHQQKLQATAHELKQAEQRKTEESKSQWSKFQGDETAKIIERFPELKDPEKSKQFQTAAVELFKSAGFADSDLNAIGSGEKFSPFHAGFQEIIMKAVKYDQAQKAVPKAVPKTVPTVQRPGVAQPKGAAADVNIQALSQRLTQTGSLKDAMALRAAKLSAGKR